MAEFDAQVNQSEEVERLRYLEIVHLAVIRAVLCASNLYCFAKENAGPLKNGVDSVEGTVKAVVGPVYERYRTVPFELLKLADRKACLEYSDQTCAAAGVHENIVGATISLSCGLAELSGKLWWGIDPIIPEPDYMNAWFFLVGESVQELERHMPEGVKEAYAKAQKAPEVARSVAGEVHRAGVVGIAAGLAKAACAHVEPTAERLATSAWQSLNRLPVFPQVAHTVLPIAGRLSERYNHAVSCAAEKGYAAAAYLPLVPTERLAKVFAA